MTEPADLRSRLRGVADTFLALRPTVLAREPWPLAADFGHGPEAAWGPPEVLAHVTEMLPYWLGEVERILAGWPTPVPFGRVATDEVRIAIIGRDRTVPLRELFDRIEADVARYERRLAELSIADLARQGLHPVRGSMSVQTVLDVIVVEHLEEHCAQLRELLAAAG
jgi:DinB superfamily